MYRLRTGLSAAFWCDPRRGYTFEKAFLPTVTRAKTEAETQQTAWFDELFEGGLLIPEKGSGAAMTILITGLPGTGKSTLSLELCYRTAIAKGNDHLRSLYITTEGHAPWLIQHAREFGWDPPTSNKKRVFSDADIESPVFIRSLKTERDLSEFLKEVDESPIKSAGNDQHDGDLLQTFRDFLCRLHGDTPKPFAVTGALGHKNDAEGTLSYPSGPPSHQGGRRAPQISLANLDIVVFDNLNTMPIEKGLWFKLLSELGKAGPRLVLIVLDASHKDGSAEAWEYLADTVIRMDHASPGGYMIRTIEIVKSRYQLSALGRHQVKVQKAYPLTKTTRKGETTITKVNGQAAADSDLPLLMRHHPFREEGGIFIYPSMHFVLSRHKYLHTSPEYKAIPTAFDSLTPLLAGGFRPGRCVALAGGSGTHKSRLAFIQLLSTLCENGHARGIIISLGEDEETMRSFLAEIEREQFVGLRSKDTADSLVASGRLEIAYYPPGFITPEEFFHRLELSIARHRAAAGVDAPLLVVFNSLNLLHSHFPLCAEHKIFIPAVIELLGHQGVTSFFVTARSGITDEYGLLSLADPILEFKRVTVRKSLFFDRILPSTVDTRALTDVGERVTLVRLQVARFAGGTSAGAHLYVLLVSGDDTIKQQLGRAGLYLFKPR